MENGCLTLALSFRCHIDGFMQERRNSRVLAMELRLSYTNPLICRVAHIAGQSYDCLHASEAVLMNMGKEYPDSKAHGANMGPIWGRQDPGGTHVGPMNFAIWVQSGAVITQYNIAWFMYSTQYCSGSSITGTSNQIWYSQKTPHISPSEASCRVSILRIVKKTDHVIRALHCIWNFTTNCI